MAFKCVNNPYTGLVEQEYYVTDSESITKGQALKFASGRLTSATAAAAIAAIALHSVTGGTDQTCKVLLVLPGMVFEVGYTGTPDGGFVPGCNSCDIASGGLLLNAADVTGGPCAMLSKDTTNTTALVTIVSRGLS